MSKDMAATPAKAKTAKMTKAEFLIVLDEVNATVARQIEEVRERQARTKALHQKTRESIAATREILLNL